MGVFVLFGLALSAGVGWLLFRRMLMPAQIRLKPSGARPWSRTRVPNPESLAGLVSMDVKNANAAPAVNTGMGALNNGQAQPSFDANMQNGYAQPGFDMSVNNGHAQQGVDANMSNGYAQPSFDMGMNNGYAQNGFNPSMSNGYAQQGFNASMHNGYAQQGFDMGMNNGYAQNGFNPSANNGYAQQGFNASMQNGPAPAGFDTPALGFHSFSDSFVPPSPQGDMSMLPPNTNALTTSFPSNGYAPNSNGFNAMYGLPNDPFASSQSGGLGWLDTMGNGPGFGNQQGPVSGNPMLGEPNMNDPYLAEVIRQYTQKGQAVQPPRPSPPERRPGGPNSDWAK